MIRVLRHLAHEGPRHDGRYGFGGRGTRYAAIVNGPDGWPVLAVDPDTWGRLKETIEAEDPARWGFGSPLTGMPVVVTDRIRP